MKKYTVRISPVAQGGLWDIYAYVLDVSGSKKQAEKYTDGIIDFCESFSSFPERSIKRDDLFSGLRLTNYKSRIRIGYLVNEDKRRIDVVLVEPVSKDFSKIEYVR